MTTIKTEQEFGILRRKSLAEFYLQCLERLRSERWIVAILQEVENWKDGQHSLLTATLAKSAVPSVQALAFGSHALIAREQLLILRRFGFECDRTPNRFSAGQFLPCFAGLRISG